MPEITKKQESSILIIDDIPANIQALATYLSKEGYDVAACTDSKKAMTSIIKTKPDLILLDIMMPDISGLEICIAIKKEKSIKDIPVIFLTAQDKSKLIVEGFEAGAVDYITKPYNSAEVLARIKTHLELQQMRKSLLDMNMKLVAQSKAKCNFLAKMSHEIRTPLNAIIGMVSKLNQQKLYSYQHKYMQVLDNTCNSLLYVVNDILDLSKIEAGEYRLESKTFDLWDTIEKTCEISAFLAHQKQIEMICNIGTEVVQYVEGDAIRLQQVLHNLINNAIKFTTKGEIELKVIQKESPQKDKVFLRFSVRDTGVGISDEYKQHIFDNYKQVNNEQKNAYSGTGLGLPICQKIVELMKGYLSVQSEINKGSTFSFSVPFLKSEKTTQINMSEPLKDKHIFIFDHNKANSQVLGAYLEFLGAKVDVSGANGEYGHLLIKQSDDSDQPYAIIFIDAKFKDKSSSFSDGFSLASQLVNAKKDIKIVLLFDTQNIEEDISRVETMPICGYLLKPYKRNELISLIDRIFNLKPVLNETQPQLPQPSAIGDINILLVEDHPNNQFVFFSYMDESPAEIDVAENGEIAVQKIKENKYDIIFMDIEMPVMNGYESTLLIREWEKTNDLHPTPIIALTAHVLNTDSHQMQKKGFTDILHKPLKQQALMDMLIRYVSQ
ncbi:multi-sensor hybrid histidine kinase [Candidatus Magnetomorum sp. HK-1]|nr:multi-sensor hybrid histidine kinase [Candidatus Magnetomorum sp. HK-1]